jgi:hypothetical protein
MVDEVEDAAARASSRVATVPARKAANRGDAGVQIGQHEVKIS